MRRLSSTERLLKEYEVLSEDRREAIKIFLTAATLATAILGFGLGKLGEARNELEIWILLGLALGFAIIFLPVAIRCRRHDEEIHRRLAFLSSCIKVAPVVSTRYIFNAVFMLGGFLVVAWIVVGIYKLNFDVGSADRVEIKIESGSR